MTLHPHPTLKSITGLQLRPPVHRSHLHTQHLLIPVLGLKVIHRLRLLDPRVPHHAVHQILTLDVETRLAFGEDGGGVLLDGLVHAVDFAGDGDGGVRLSLFGRVEDFVDIGRAAEAGDGGFGDILQSKNSQRGAMVGLLWTEVLRQRGSRCAAASGTQSSLCPRCSRSALSVVRPSTV